MTQINPLCGELVYQLRQIGKYEQDPHKRASYMKAADAIMSDVENFESHVINRSFKLLSGVGDSIDKKIDEFLMLGYIPKLRELQSGGDK